MNLVIRPMRPEDRATLVDFVHALNVAEQAISADRRTDREGAELALADTEQDVAEKDGIVLVAEVDGRLAGFAGWYEGKNAPYVAPEFLRYGYVSDLFVAEAFRGAGVARALLAEAERLTRSRGLPRLYIGALVGNEQAERAYTRFGFAPYATTLMKDLI